MIKVALVGNPNSGKTSLFNALTGLNQKVGNFPGVTVEKKTSKQLLENKPFLFIDLPGTYSLNPRSLDEQVAFEILVNPHHADHPDVVVVVADATNLTRSLLFASQVIDLGIPTVLALNMMDVATRAKIKIDEKALAIALGVPVVTTNALNKIGIEQIKKLLIQGVPKPAIHFEDFNAPDDLFNQQLFKTFPEASNFQLHVLGAHLDKIVYSKPEIGAFLNSFETLKPAYTKLFAADTIKRYSIIAKIVKQVQYRPTAQTADRAFTKKLDQWLTHSVFGYVIFLLILFLMFQAIFSWSSYPMDAIEWLFTLTGEWIGNSLPDSIFKNLLVNGVIAGLSGVIVFLPQIMLLSAFVAILEDTGYLARVSFLTDKLMRKLGVSGKSIVPLMGGYACAVPSIMATRTISNWKERIITIMITPLMSCSARLPVYTLLIGICIPDGSFLGFNLKGWVMMGFYLLGFVAAIGVALLLKWIIKQPERSTFMLEMPIYRMPRWGNIGMVLMSKSRAFVQEAGKIIIAISIILWFLSNFGPSNAFEKIEQKYTQSTYSHLNDSEKESAIQSEKLANSYAGHLGKWIEPAIAPLGFDWKIGIALITSFAAREVFVGTMATIYSMETHDFDPASLQAKMERELNPVNGKPRYSLAMCLSLMVFYAFAMQCMSTLAITKKETGSWKWPALQFGYMTLLAYTASWFVYTLFA